jgi:hypothetical protein
MRGHAEGGIPQRRGGWSAVVWTAVVLSGALVRTVLSANDSDVPFAFPLAAIWLVAAVSAAHWTACRWVGRNG